MIIKGNAEIRSVTGISSDEEKDIMNFLQGAVYCWCKNHKDEWFSSVKPCEKNGVHGPS